MLRITRERYFMNVLKDQHVLWLDVKHESKQFNNSSRDIFEVIKYFRSRGIGLNAPRD